MENVKISVLKVIGNTAADGPGLRTSVYLAGCSHHCPGCHNPQSWDIGNGRKVEIDDLIEEIESYGNKKVTITGGDPFDQPEQLYELLRRLKGRDCDIQIWVYTGYRYEDLRLDSGFRGYSLRYIDGLVDGPFIQELRDTSLKFRGSSNQKIYLRDSQGNLREDKEKYSS